MVVAQRTADAVELVRGDRDADASAANEDAFFKMSGKNFLADLLCDFRVVHTIGRVAANVGELIAFFG